MQIVGIYIYNGVKKILKNLKENTWYPFGDIENCEGIFSSEEKYKEIKNTLKENRTFVQKLYRRGNKEILEEKSPFININCIVGKNGSGKSTLLEIYHAIINNFAYEINKNLYTVFKPIFVYGFNAALYFELDGEIGCIKISNNKSFESQENRRSKISFYYINEINLQEIKNMPDLKEKIYSHFFYTIATNYSFYSYAGLQNDWIDNIFQKNDGYFTPTVLVPYRYNNTIEFNKEYHLAQERIKILSILLCLSNNDSFFENYLPYEINYVLKDYETNLLAKIRGLLTKQDIISSIYSSDDLNEIKNNELLKNLNIAWIKKLKKLGIEEKNDSAYKASVLYLCYKTIKIFKTYGTLIFGKNYSLSDNVSEIVEHLADITKLNHINLKIIQCINFLKDRFYTVTLEENIVSIEKFMKYFKSKKLDFSYDNIFIFLPPDFFDIDISYKKKNTSEIMHLYDLSSGEQQFLYSVSYFVYHIKNVESIQNDSENRVFYKNVSLILDEAELYYHPEYQRMFISKMLDIFNRSHFEKIDSINITVITHSPFMLSDVPSSNILCLNNGYPETKFLQKTLGANIYDLLKNQFFMDSSIGGVPEKIINEIIDLYEGNKEKNINTTNEEISFYRQFVQEIGDEYLVDSLGSMLSEIEKRINDAENRLFTNK